MRSAMTLGIGILLLVAAPGLYGQAKPAAAAATKPAPAAATPAAKPAPQAAKPAASPAPQATTPAAKPAAPAAKAAAPSTPQAAKPAAKPAPQAPQAAAKAGAKPRAKSSSGPKPTAKKTEKPTDTAAATGPEAKMPRRDPFESLVSRQQAQANAISHLPPGKAGLQVSTLRLDGVVKAPNGMIAVVTNPQARTYFLREGDQLYDGRVEKIAMDGVSFHEEGKDAFGKPVERQVNKRIYSSPGEQQ